MAAAEEPDPIRLDAIAIEPNPAPLTAQLDVHVDFEAQDTFPQAFWEITVRESEAKRGERRAKLSEERRVAKRS